MDPYQMLDEWYFTGEGATYGTFDGAAAADDNSVDPPFSTDLTDTAHGLFADSLLYIEGSVNYNGLRKIKSVPDANSMIIFAKYVAEVLGGTETWKTMFTYDNIIQGSPRPGSHYEFLGFEITLSAAGATPDDTFTITIDSAKGSAWDNLIYSKDMNGIADINYMFDEPRECGAGDKIDVAWANADARSWGIKLYTKRLV